MIKNQFYNNPYPVYYPDEQFEPVPGWGVTPNMAGPRMVGVGAADTGSTTTPYDQAGACYASGGNWSGGACIPRSFAPAVNSSGWVLPVIGLGALVAVFLILRKS